MQIKRLRIDKHLCLVDFDIRFATVSGGSSTILIGENGAGDCGHFQKPVGGMWKTARRGAGISAWIGVS